MRAKIRTHQIPRETMTFGELVAWRQMLGRSKFPARVLQVMVCRCGNKCIL